MTDATPSPKMRCADTDREAVAERLRDALGEGRIDLDELDERLELTYRAKTFADLAVVTDDLPDPGLGLAPASPAGEPVTLRSGGALEKSGYWQVPRHLVVRSAMGGAKLDFTASDCRHREVLIELGVGMGGVLVIVPPGWSVDVDGVSCTMGRISNRVNGIPEPGRPMLRFVGQVAMGGMKIRHPSRFEAARARRILETGRSL